MLDIGLIGLGPEWDSRYRPAILRQGGRVAVRALFTPVGSRAAAVCDEFECELAHSVSDLVSRPTVQAVVVLDSAWFSIAPVEFACRARKPVLLVDPVRTSQSSFDHLAHLADDLGTMITPDLVHRYTPATARLRELMATKLGKPAHFQLEISAQPGAGAGTVWSRFLSDTLAAAFDWCHSVSGAVPSQISPVVGSTQSGRFQVDVQFAPFADRSRPPTARIGIRSPAGDGTSPNAPEGSPPAFVATVECQRGRVLLHDAEHVIWSFEADERDESLATEREAFDVLLDHFARRVVGGLIPIATLNEALRARAWAAAARCAVDAGISMRLDRRTGNSE